MAFEHLIGFDEKIVSAGTPAGMAPDGGGQDRRLAENPTRLARVSVPSRNLTRHLPRAAGPVGLMWPAALDRAGAPAMVAPAALMERPDA